MSGVSDGIAHLSAFPSEAWSVMRGQKRAYFSFFISPLALAVSWLFGKRSMSS